MWMLLKFRLLSSLGILHACQCALHKLHDMEGGKKEEKRMAKLFRRKFNSYIPGNFIYQSLCIYDEHDLVNIYKDWPVVV